MHVNGRRLFRSRSERVLGGVAGGVADYLDLDPALVRVAWAILILATGGAFLVLYVIMWIVVPEAPPGTESGRPWASAGAPVSANDAPGATDAPGANDAPGATEAAAASADPGAAKPSSIAQDWRARRGERRGGSGGGALVFGSLLILVGAWLLARNYFPLLDADRIWPIAVILLGVLLLVGALRPRS
jgi:phage shock protein C